MGELHHESDGEDLARRGSETDEADATPTVSLDGVPERSFVGRSRRSLLQIGPLSPNDADRAIGAALGGRR